MKNLFFVAFMLLFAGKLFAGYEISVCDSINAKGTCLGKNDIFHYAGDKMKLQVLVRNKEMLRTTKILYKVYFMKNDHEGDIYAELSSGTHLDWFAAAKKIVFVKPGYYKLEVFKADKTKIGTTFITITDR